MKVAAIKCLKCNDVVWSRHRHDYHPCKCGAVAIDGGREYTRVIGEPTEMTFLPEHEVTVTKGKKK